MHSATAVLMGAAFVFLPSTDVLAALAGLVWHEGAHLLAMHCCGAEDCSIEITPFGGIAEGRAFEKLCPASQAVCAGSGVAASALAFAGLQLLENTHPMVDALERVNLSLAFVNCLPVWPLDGARVIASLASMLGHERLARKALQVLSWVVGILLSGLGLYSAWIGHLNPSLLLCGPYLCYAAGQGTVGCRIRQMEQLDHKLTEQNLLPVDPYVCPAGCERGASVKLLGRAERGRYQVMLVADPETGRIIKVYTERELKEDIVGAQP